MEEPSGGKRKRYVKKQTMKSPAKTPAVINGNFRLRFLGFGVTDASFFVLVIEGILSRNRVKPTSEHFSLLINKYNIFAGVFQEGEGVMQNAACRV